MKLKPGKSALKRSILEMAGIITGVILTALSLNLFLIPHRLAAGGISGLAVVFYYLFEFPVGLTILVINVPLFIVSYYLLGRGILLRSMLGTLLLSAFVELLAFYLPLTATGDILLASVYGGVIMGIGMGLVFRYRGSTGGTSLIALILNRLTGLSAGQALLGSDLLIIALAIFVFGGEVAMYAALSLFISSWVIDVVQEGLGLSKVALLITSRGHEINERLLQELGRGVTRVEVQGGFTGKPRELLICVVSRLQVAQLKAIVQEVDPASFLVIGNATEVHGEGFRKMIT